PEFPNSPIPQLFTPLLASWGEIGYLKAFEISFTIAENDFWNLRSRNGRHVERIYSRSTGQI
ncbi:MAG: hypothetical protein PVF44_12980, partial [Syntrophobacterales bacterium]